MRMNHPVYLIIDKEENILVAYLNNSRVLLLSPTLEFLIEVVFEKHGLRHPRRIIAWTNGRLIVACVRIGPNPTNSDVGKKFSYSTLRKDDLLLTYWVRGGSRTSARGPHAIEACRRQFYTRTTHEV